MSCQKCGSDRTASMSAKCSDCCFVKIGSGEKSGYVPRDMGIGGGDYVKFHWCLDCGHIQGEWPVPKTELETPPDT